MGVVLLVLNRTDDREYCHTSLGPGGFSLHEIHDPSEVIARAADSRASAVIVATDNPNRMCERVCRSLRSERAMAGIPLLILAESDQDRSIPECLKAGADDYVVRGCSPEVLLRRLRRLIRDRQLTMSAIINEQLAQVGRLLTGIVHEIRSPLTVIRGQVELLRLSLDGGEESERYLEPISRNIQLMQTRLDHLMAAVRTGAPTLELVDINEVVREAADLFQKGADPRRDRVAVESVLTEGLPPIPADAGRIIQVLMNLLANGREAILATEKAGVVRLQTTLAQDQDRSWLMIHVEDDGPGIPEGLLDRIFEPFFTTKSGGSGYGLYLSSEIVREHGGRLTACRSPLGGACFLLWLPIPPTTRPPGAAPASTA